MSDNRKRIVLTGATGFVGSAVMKGIAAMDDLVLRACVRNPASLLNLPGIEAIPVADMTAHTDWSPAVDKAEVVIHAAARAHIMNDQATDPLSEYRAVNVEGTLNLAGQAVLAGVRRFIFLSSIKVNGEETLPGQPFTPDDPVDPQDAYAVSKQEAEDELHRLAAETGLEVVVIRPPLVYGPGVKANFLRIMQAVVKGLPLPLGLVRNKRSLVALDNLVDLIITCTRHPAAAGQTFLVSDGEDLSTPELVRKLAAAMGRPARLLPVPPVFTENRWEHDRPCCGNGALMQLFAGGYFQDKGSAGLGAAGER